MAKKFIFKSNNLELDIAGNTFDIDIVDPELVARLEEFSINATSYSNELAEKAKDANYEEVVTEAITFILDSIDSVLGEGASKKIFAGRKVRFFDAVDVMYFVVDEVNAAKDDSFNRYAPNRAQRRAKK